MGRIKTSGDYATLYHLRERVEREIGAVGVAGGNFFAGWRDFAGGWFVYARYQPEISCK